MKRIGLTRRTELARTTRLERRTPLASPGELTRTSTLQAAPLKSSGPISPATPEQKAKVEGLACLALDNGNGPCWGPIDPAHVIDRSMAPSGGDDIRAVVPLCRRHHNHYDDLDLDLSPLLEPRWRVEVAWAVEAVGLFSALRRITGHRWTPVEEGHRS
jgi:hypothetical protein